MPDEKRFIIMFFNKAKDARIRASIDNVALEKIGMRHLVVPCKKYLVNPNYFGMDYFPGFTLVLVKINP